ncbi:DUF6541 family protein [uncultured Chloroflexus sp.]|uniref:DUF6541 family protein n=1 Tax=uncultured Chloroflexus sp. TaxID=214040 RepID=UPI00260BF3A0|nr:DUF6541 family protein [uncultured Chloroflexus sp.]
MVADKRALPRSVIWLAVIWLAAIISMAVPGLLWWAPWSLLTSLLAVLSGALLFTLPGLAVLRWLHPGPLLWFERLAYAASLSGAIIPFLLLVSEPIGWRWNSLAAWLVMIVFVALALWPVPRIHRPDRGQRCLIGWMVAWLSVAALAVRLFAVRDVPVGLFGDSYHHTIITQLLIDHGGLFQSWQPYAPAVTFTYHYGFHAIAAWWHWLAGIPPTQAVVLVGQVMSGLAAPLLYLLTARLTNSRLTGLWAAVVVGFLSLYPAYYVNWGRYTQLAGQTVLPAVAVAWMELIDGALSPQRSWRSLAAPLALASIASAGLAFSHYRVAILAICFVVTYTLVALGRSGLVGWRTLRRLGGAGILGALGAALLAWPWLWRVQQGQITRMAAQIVTTDVETRNPIALEIIGAAFQYGLFPLAAIGLISLLWRRQSGGLVLALWAGLVWLAANPQLLGLTGQGLITTFAVLIGAYLVVAPAAGAGLLALIRLGVMITKQAQRRLSATMITIQIVAGLVLVGWGAPMQAAMVDYDYQLATPADLKAAAWIREHLPPDAAIFVNGFPAYGGYVYAGSDGGWWLTFLTGRRTNLLPMAVGFEATDPPNTLRLIAEQHQAVQRYPIGSAQAVAALRALGFHYLYNGPAANPSGEYLDPVQIDAAPFYELIYRQDGVSIWRIR